MYNCNYCSKLTYCYRFRWNEEGCRDAVVISSVPVSESRSYFEIGKPLSRHMNCPFL